MRLLGKVHLRPWRSLPEPEINHPQIPEMTQRGLRPLPLSRKRWYGALRYGITAASQIRRFRLNAECMAMGGQRAPVRSYTHHPLLGIRSGEAALPDGEVCQIEIPVLVGVHPAAAIYFHWIVYINV